MPTLNNAQIGDAIAYNPHGSRVYFREVTGLTATQVICGNVRFKKDTGKMIGGHHTYGRIATKDDYDHNRKLDMVASAKSRLKEVRVTSDNASQILAFLDLYEATEKRLQEEAAKELSDVEDEPQSL